MILRVCSIYDMKAELFMSPMCFRSLGEAERVFQDICNDPKTVVSKHPSDYKFYELGTFNDDDATFDLLKVPRFLIHGAVNSLDSVDSLLK